MKRLIAYIHMLQLKRAIRIARRDYMRHVQNNHIPNGFEGLCWYTIHALNWVFQDFSYSKYDDSVLYIQSHLPKYTYENAAKYFGAEGSPHGLWWKNGDWQSRMRFLDWLEENL